MQMPWTSLGKRELEEREMSVKSVRRSVPDEEDLEMLNWLRNEYRTGVISRVAFVEQAIALGLPWLDVEYDAYRIDTEDDQI
jgi:hypothetical protein